MPGGNVMHYGSVRILGFGSGILESLFRDYALETSQQLADITLTDPMNTEPRVLANFVNQGAVLRLEQNVIHYTMDVNTITIFVKPIWTEYPNGF